MLAARAIENKVFLVASGYDHPTYVMDPNGERLSVAKRGAAAVSTIDLRSISTSDIGTGIWAICTVAA
jgi:hypothetical protein